MRAFQVDRVDPTKEQAFRAIDAFSHLRLSGTLTLASLLACRADLQAGTDGYRFLCTLDDVNQCCYTSMHASSDDRLYLPEDYDDDETPAQALARRERQFAHVVQAMGAPAHQVAWSSLAGTLLCNDADIAALAQANAAPDRILDDVAYLQRVPAVDDHLLLAALPNGYFSADWNLFQNHALARHLQQQHGYRLFGLGASWLGFVRDTAPDAAAAEALVNDLRQLYGPAGSEESWAQLQHAVQGGTTVLLGYTERFSDALG